MGKRHPIQICPDNGQRGILWSCGVFGLTAVALLCILLFARPADANRIKPGLSTELGFTDNVKFRTGEEDFFFKVTPSLQVSAGPASNNFSANASAGWTQYFLHADESDLESVNIKLAYNRAFSPRFNCNIANSTVATYDVIDRDIEGQPLSTVTPGTKSYNNTTTAATQYRWGEFDMASAQYSFKWSRFESDASTENTSHKVLLKGQGRVAINWRAEASLEGGRSFFEESENKTTVGARVGMVRMLGPQREAFLRISGTVTRVDTDDVDIAGAKDYDVYGVTTGIDWAFNSVTKAGLHIGADYIDGNDTLNQAAGDVYPNVSAYIRYTGQTWSVAGRFSSALNDLNFEGQDAGLTNTSRASVDFNWDFMQHWSFFTTCTIIYENPLQTNDIITTDATGATDIYSERMTYSATTGINWQFAKHSNLGLRYKVDYRDSDTLKDESRSRNEISLIFTTYHDFMW